MPEQAEQAFPRSNIITLRQDDPVPNWWRGWIGEEPQFLDQCGPNPYSPWCRAVSVGLVLFGIAEQLRANQWQLVGTNVPKVARPEWGDKLVVVLGQIAEANYRWEAWLCDHGRWQCSRVSEGPYDAWLAVAKLAIGIVDLRLGELP